MATDLLALALLTAAGRIRRRHRGRLGPALRRADGLWRAACGIFRDPRCTSSARCRAASSASRSTRNGQPALCAWRCRRASSISGARRRRAISAPRRFCWPSSPPCSPSINGPEGIRKIAERTHRYAEIFAAARDQASAMRSPPSHSSTRSPCVCRAAPMLSRPRRASSDQSALRRCRHAWRSPSTVDPAQELERLCRLLQDAMR